MSECLIETHTHTDTKTCVYCLINNFTSSVYYRWQNVIKTHFQTSKRIENRGPTIFKFHENSIRDSDRKVLSLYRTEQSQS